VRILFLNIGKVQGKPMVDNAAGIYGARNQPGDSIKIAPHDRGITISPGHGHYMRARVGNPLQFSG
jgi:hypothetical protein